MDQIITLLKHYNFEFGICASDRSQNLSYFLNQKWQDYQLNWIHLAVVEAIYQGRYKVASVDYILRFWQKRTVPICRFDRDFERLICSDFGLSVPNKGIPTEKYSINQTANQVPAVKQEHRLALKQMQLLAESSLFVDKLKSMCDPELLLNTTFSDSSLIDNSVLEVSLPESKAQQTK